MSNKSLIIKSPSTIDADLLKYNVLRVFTTLPANYSSNNGYIGNQKLTIEKIEGDTDTDVIGNGTNIVSGINNSTTSQKRIVFDISPIDAITKVGVGQYTLANLKSIMGEGLAALKGLTDITTIEISNESAGRVNNPSEDTILSGDIAELKTLTNLTSLSLNGTKVSGDIAELKTFTRCRAIYISETNVWGDLSVLNPSVLKVSGGSSKSNQKLSWSSPTNRSSKTNIPLVITDGNGKGAWDFGDDVDKLFIDEAACTNYSGNPMGKYINVKGNRTSASDNAIQTLQNNGWTVKIN